MQNTKRLFFFLALVVLLPITARSQLQQSGGGGSAVSITQGGNTVAVDAGNSLKTNIGEFGGTAVSLGSKVSASSMPVVIASDQGAINVSPTANHSVNVNQLGGASITLGSKTGANSLPVVIASDQGTLPVSGTFWQATQPVSGTLAATQSGTWNVGLNAGTNLIGKVVKASTCGTTPFDSGLTENIATGAGTDLATSAMCVEALYITNVTGSPVNVTLKDKSGTPKSYMTTFSLPANSNIVLPLWGMKFTGGVTVIAGTASALNSQVVGYQ